jgi:Fic family protein
MSRYEERIWIPAPNAPGGRSNRQSFRYRAYVPDDIGTLDPALSATAFKLIGDADNAVRGLNRDLPEVAGIEALARQLLRQESVASSRIEGLQMSQRRLARAAMAAELDDAVDMSAEAIMGNIRAMEMAVTTTSARRALSMADIVGLHRTLLEATRDARLAGWVRDRQNWIGGNNHNPRRAAFIPPPENHVPRLLEDLAIFLNRRDLPATLQAAVAHAQFETIHPFADGNGRVGRCLIHVVFRRADLAPRYVPPISLVLATEADDYVRGLTTFRGGDLEDWCSYFAVKTLEATRKARGLATRVRRQRDEWMERAGRPRRGSAALRLIDALAGQPVLDVGVAARLTGASDEAARRAVNRLADAGILTQVTVGRRNRAWEAREVFELLNDFEYELATPEGEDAPVRAVPHL